MCVCVRGAPRCVLCVCVCLFIYSALLSRTMSCARSVVYVLLRGLVLYAVLGLDGSCSDLLPGHASEAVAHTIGKHRVHAHSRTPARPRSNYRPRAPSFSPPPMERPTDRPTGPGRAGPGRARPGLSVSRSPATNPGNTPTCKQQQQQQQQQQKWILVAHAVIQQTAAAQTLPSH